MIDAPLDNCLWIISPFAFKVILLIVCSPFSIVQFLIRGVGYPYHSLSILVYSYLSTFGFVLFLFSSLGLCTVRCCLLKYQFLVCSTLWRCRSCRRGLSRCYTWCLSFGCSSRQVWRVVNLHLIFGLNFIFGFRFFSRLTASTLGPS